MFGIILFAVPWPAVRPAVAYPDVRDW